jgi:acetylornithine deacetylase/succinyl-diaminopimelate desuccinylase-like protein
MTTSDDILEILRDLIAIPSGYPPGDSSAICAYAADRLGKAGYDVSVLTKTAPMDNVVARMGSGKPSIVFNAHVDTVAVADRSEWQTDPWSTGVSTVLARATAKAPWRCRSGSPKRSPGAADRSAVKWFSLLWVTRKHWDPTGSLF